MTNKQVTNPSLPIDKNAILFGTCSTHTHTQLLTVAQSFLLIPKDDHFAVGERGGGGEKTPKILEIKRLGSGFNCGLVV